MATVASDEDVEFEMCVCGHVISKQVQNGFAGIDYPHSSTGFKERPGSLTIFDLLRRSLATILPLLSLFVSSFWPVVLISGAATHSANGPRTMTKLSSDPFFSGCLDQAPYVEHSDIISRVAELDYVHQALTKETSAKGRQRIVLGGIAGVGKTYLALDYAKQKQEQGYFDMIFWVDATTEATVVSSFESILNCLPGILETESLSYANIFSTFSGWLSTNITTRWLLIFDNHNEPNSYNLASYYPEALNGSIIITTRRLDEIDGSKLELEVFDNIEDNLELLGRWAQRSKTFLDDSSRQLIDVLEALPIAIIAAGAYLRDSDWSCEQYLHAYEAQWSLYSPQDIQSLDQQSRTMHTTLDLLFQNMQKYDQMAVQMLRLLAYFGNQPLWFDLFKNGKRNTLPDWLSALTTEQDDFNRVMYQLVDYGFIDVRSDLQTYVMHTYHHDWIISRLIEQVEPWSFWYAVSSIARSIENDKDLGRPRFARFTPHALRLTHVKFNQVIEEADEDQIEELNLVYRLLSQQKQTDAAEELLNHILRWKEQAFGISNPRTLLTVIEFGHHRGRQHRFEESEQWYFRALSGYQRAFGMENELTAQLLSEIGFLYVYQNKLVQAEKMYVQSLAAFDQALGPESEKTMRIVYRLGSIYMDVGKFQAAECMFQRALASTLNRFGTMHMSTLENQKDLGFIYRNQGKFLEAANMYKEALAGFEQVLGPEHMTTLEAIHDLGFVYQHSGRLIEAEELYDRCLMLCEKVFGTKHENTLSQLMDLGSLYHSQNRLDEAEVVHLRVLTAYEEILGVDDISTLRAVGNLAGLYQQQGRMVDAEQMHERTVAGFERALGLEHPLTLSAVSHIASFYSQKGESMKAEEMFVRAMTGLSKAGVPAAGVLTTTAHNFGLLYKDQGRLEEAEPMFIQSLAGFDQIYGAEHGLTYKAFHTLGQLYLDQGKLMDAQELSQRYPKLQIPTHSMEEQQHLKAAN